MPNRTYRMPTLHADVQVLTPQSNDGKELGPHTEVLCINRGRKTLFDKFDGVDYVIPTGEFLAPYGAAKHFQDRLVIPGTRNVESNEQQSFIGIKALDDDWMCEPLTDDECRRFGEAVEGIDRSLMTDPSGRKVQIESMAGLRGSLRSQGSPKGQAFDLSQQGSEEARAAAAEVMTPPEESLAQKDEKEATMRGAHQSARNRRKAADASDEG